MNKRSIIAIGIAAFMTTAAAGVVIAHPQGRGGNESRMERGAGRHANIPFGRLGVLKEKLNLSDQQVEQIRAIYDQLREQNASYREDLRSTRGSALEALIDNPDDVAGAQALAEKRLNAERALKANMIAATAKAMKVLSPEQRAKLSQILEQRRERREERMELRREMRERRRG